MSRDDSTYGRKLQSCLNKGWRRDGEKGLLLCGGFFLIQENLDTKSSLVVVLPLLVVVMSLVVTGTKVLFHSKNEKNGRTAAADTAGDELILISNSKYR